MTALTVLVPRIRASIPMVPSFVAQQYVLQAAREFFEKTRGWRYSFTLTTTTAPTYDLTASLPSNTELVDVVSMKPTTGGARLTPKTYDWLDENEVDWRNQTATTAKYYLIESNNVIRLISTPDSAVSYYTRVAVKPTLDATEIDDLMNNKYDEALINGALSRMFALPEKPWSSGELAAYYRNLFQQAIDAGITEAVDENQQGVVRTVRYGGY